MHKRLGSQDNGSLPCLLLSTTLHGVFKCQWKALACQIWNGWYAEWLISSMGGHPIYFVWDNIAPFCFLITMIRPNITALHSIYSCITIVYLLPHAYKPNMANKAEPSLICKHLWLLLDWYYSESRENRRPPVHGWLPQEPLEGSGRSVRIHSIL
jgi:hypothetical protein